ncbi:MAG: PAS domain-containing protein, partial [Candidatus Abyssubacteria bacterium]|nr:PAS domain-containing protein [Candidatus Abyssubacteria bacterium]
MCSQETKRRKDGSNETDLRPALHEQALQDSPDLVSILDRDYVYRTVNSTYLKRYRKKREDMVGHSVTEILGEEVFEKIIRPNLDRCFAGETVSYQAWVAFPKLGKRYMDVYYYPLPDWDGSVPYVGVFVRDITDRK